MANPTLLHEFGQFLRANLRYWLIPIVVMLVAVGALIIASQSSAVAPFIYTLF